MHKNLKRGLSQGALQPEAKTWPGPAELTILRITGSLWPTSDMNHAVVSPARVLMGAYLGLARVRSLNDIASGLFLCTLFLAYEQLSQRFVPEAVNFLVNTVLHLAPNKYQNASELPGSFPSPDFRSSHCRQLALDAKSARGLKIQKPDFGVLLTSEDLDDASKLNLLALSLDLLGRYADLLKGLEAFVEIFDPIAQILSNLKLQKYEVDLQVSCIFTSVLSLPTNIHMYRAGQSQVIFRDDRATTQIRSSIPTTPPPPSTQSHSHPFIRSQIRHYVFIVLEEPRS